MHQPESTRFPVVSNLSEFDRKSGSVVECLLFNHRAWVVVLCLLTTLFLGWKATGLQLNASFEKTIPAGHPYIANYLRHQEDLRGLGNAIRIGVVSRSGSIYNAEYMETLRKLNDQVFLIPGVDRAGMKSLWTPSTRWTGVTEEGMEGGPVIPDGYDGSLTSLQQLRANVDRSGELGQLVAVDGSASVLYVPLLSQLPDGTPIDYAKLSKQLEELRSSYQQGDVELHITGFAKIVGDLIEGLREVLKFFAIAVTIVSAMVFSYTRCVRSTGWWSSVPSSRSSGNWV